MFSKSALKVMTEHFRRDIEDRLVRDEPIRKKAREMCGCTTCKNGRECFADMYYEDLCRELNGA